MKLVYEAFERLPLQPFYLDTQVKSVN
jgi:hypothetical protein